MAIPTSPVDKNWPKGPNFLGIVIGFAVAIVVVLILAFVLVRGKGRKLMNTGTHSTPSQSMIQQGPQFQPGSRTRVA